MERVVEKHPRDAARGMGKVECVRAMTADYATTRDLRSAVEIDAERVDDRQRVVRKELAAEFVARKRVAIDERDGMTAPREKSSQCRAARAGADDGDIDIHRSASTGRTVAPAGQRPALRSVISTA